MMRHTPRHNAIAPRDASSAARRNAGAPIVVGDKLRKQPGLAHY